MPPKKRLIALGVALNLELSDVGALLFAFDRSNLTQKDIPDIIKTAPNARLSDPLHPTPKD